MHWPKSASPASTIAAAGRETNLATGREIRIRTAARLRSEAPLAAPITAEEARRIVDEIEF